MRVKMESNHLTAFPKSLTAPIPLNNDSIAHDTLKVKNYFRKNNYLFFVQIAY